MECAVATYSQIHRQRLLQEVEGYLDLATVLEDRYPLSTKSRDQISHRALRTLDRVDESTKRSPIVLHLKGKVFRLMKRYNEAIEPLLAASVAEPENIHILLTLGWCYKRTNKIDSAIQALEHALVHSPYEAIIHYNLACYWSLANNVPLALVYLSQSFDLDPEYREMVSDEPDFDSLRDHPEFVTLTSVIV